MLNARAGVAARASTGAEYFPAVDGLRALAVASVVAYHLNGMLPGGFVGVDIFFVISGFVVAHSAAQLSGSTALSFIAAFYARRLLRIAPALIVCVVLTSLATALLVPDAWLSEGNSRTGLAALFGLSNYVLAFSANDYWAPRAEFNPFTHTWSLGVEEQFYFVAPLLFYVWRRGHGKLALKLLLVLAAASLLSAALAASFNRQTLAFYSIHTRLWELSAGVALALTQARWRPWVVAWPVAVQRLVMGAALALMVLALGFADGTAFPWPWALAPVLATALLILLVVAQPQAWVSQAFASGAMVWLGRLSYSLYLWHWPVFVLMRWTVGMESPWHKAAALAGAVLLAMASLRFVERPLRHRRFAAGTSQARIAGYGVAALGVAVAVSAALWALRPVISLSVTRQPDWTWDADLAVPAAKCGIKTSKQRPAGGLLVTLQPEGCGAATGRVFVVGDSHAGAYSAMLKAHVRSEGATVQLYTFAGCSVFGLRQPMQATAPACRHFTEQVLLAIGRDAQPGDVLFLPGLRIPRLADQWQPAAGAALPPEPEARRSAAVADALQALQPLAARGVAVLFEAPKPVFAVPPFRCADTFNAGNPICTGEKSTPRHQLQALRAPVLASMAEVVRGLPKAAVYDPFPWLCPGEVCEPHQTGRPLFFDGDHLSGHGNEVLLPSFKAALADLQRKTP